jgi:hypothetical protein
MIDILLKILDRLIQLVKLRKERKEKIFKELVLPIFDDLLLVQRDYIKMFEKASDDILNGIELTKIIRNLEYDRLKFEPVRTKLYFLANEFLGSEISSDIDYFIDSVIKYFPVGDIEWPSLCKQSMRDFSWATSLILELKFHFIALPEDDKQRCISRFITYQRQRWEMVCDAFAKCKKSIIINL